MGVRRLLAGLAAGAPVPVFAVAGLGGRRVVEGLYADPRLIVADSPRHAAVLLLAGSLPRGLLGPALRIHDQLPHPRATLRWPSAGDDPLAAAAFPGAAVADGDIAAAVAGLWGDLLAGRRKSEADLLLDVDPHPWRGVGPYGQGGKGMTGGVPYGRPLAERAADRDGLELDQLSVRVGPLFPAWPPGLELDVRLQGDVVQEAVAGNAYDSAFDPGPPPAASPDPFRAALGAPVAIGDLEVARARHHLRWAAGALRVAGLPALALRAARLAAGAGPGDGAAVAALARRVERDAGLRLSTSGVGVLPAGADLAGLGPVARAAGRADDARAGDPAYRALGFEPVVHPGGDVRARWRQRLAEAAQALELAARAGDARGGGDAVESPWGTLGHGGPPPALRLLELVAPAVAGLEWGDAVATIVSLDLDLEAAAVAMAAGPVR